jgi:glutamate dehydrogenase (NADP+)
MTNIYRNSVKAAEEYGHAGSLVVGANIAGFLKVNDAIVSQGI